MDHLFQWLCQFKLITKLQCHCVVKILASAYVCLLREVNEHPEISLCLNFLKFAETSVRLGEDLGLLMGTCQTVLAFVALNSEPQVKGR